MTSLLTSPYTQSFLERLFAFIWQAYRKPKPRRRRG
jgi:hypothetical protein